jgi:cytochrome P450
MKGSQNSTWIQTASKEIRYSANVLFAGGLDMSASTLNYSFMAMALFPEVHKTAKEGIDRVVGKFQTAWFRGP